MESHQPVELTAGMEEHVATVSFQRPSLAPLGMEPLRAAMEFAWNKLGKMDGAKPGDRHPVVFFPSLGADGKSVATLRAHFESSLGRSRMRELRGADCTKEERK